MSTLITEWLQLYKEISNEVDNQKQVNQN